MADDNNIWIAASDGHLSEVVAYVDGGVSVDAQDDAGYFPLAAAVSYGNLDVTHFLLSRGANVKLSDLEGDTALHVCESAECAAALVEAGADITAVNSEGKTAFEVAVEEYREEMVAYLADLYKARGLELPAVSIPAEMSAEMFEAMGEMPEGEGEEGAGGGEEESKD